LKSVSDNASATATLDSSCKKTRLAHFQLSRRSHGTAGSVILNRASQWPLVTNFTAFAAKRYKSPVIISSRLWSAALARLYESRKRVLVTGGAGFLGSHLIDRLLAGGDEVVCADNLFTGTKRNIEHLHANPRFEFIRHDVTFPLYVEVDEIYNLACPASPIQYQHDPVQTTKTSVHGAINMLGLAKRLKCRILQASTSEVYGDPAVHPQTEDYWGHVNPIGPRSCYDEGKRCAETLFFDYHRQCNLEIKVARIFNTYGPRMHPSDGRVVSNFIIQALNTQPITLYGDGSQTRSFCYVDDLIDGLVRLMNSPASFTGPVNLGNPTEFTMRELASLVLAETGSSSTLVNQPLPQDDPRQRQPNISLAKERLAWSPRINLSDGLKPTVAYFRSLN
jgi:UDP-glucuronate decarboxylase